MSNIKKKTVSFIIKEFNNKNINYAIARNYETFPLFKSDLDIFYENELEKIKRILVKAAKKFKWKYLIYDFSKSQNFLSKNKIETFYFFNLDNNNFFQIDFFKSLIIFGANYFQFNNKSFISHKNKFNILPTNISHTYHLFQISSLLNSNNKNKKKINKYKKNFLSLKFEDIYKKNIYFEKSLLKLIIFNLKRKNFFLFKFHVNIYKSLILFNFYLKNPIRIYEIFYRMYEYYLIYYKQPTGYKFFIPKNYLNKKQTKIFFDKLKNIQLIDDWNFRENINFFRRIKFLERRNVVISLTTNKKEFNLEKDFIKKFLSKNKTLY